MNTWQKTLRRWNRTSRNSAEGWRLSNKQKNPTYVIKIHQRFLWQNARNSARIANQSLRTDHCYPKCLKTLEAVALFLNALFSKTKFKNCTSSSNNKKHLWNVARKSPPSTRPNKIQVLERVVFEIFPACTRKKFRIFKKSKFMILKFK